MISSVRRPTANSLWVLPVVIVVALLAAVSVVVRWISFSTTDVLFRSTFFKETKQVDEEDSSVDMSFLSDINKTHVIPWKGVEDIVLLFGSYWKYPNSTWLCEIYEARTTGSDPNEIVTLDISFSCRDLFNDPRLGTATFIQLFLLVRLSAHIEGNVNVYIHCDDYEDTKQDLILPWMTGYFPARESDKNVSIYNYPPIADRCSTTLENEPYNFALMYQDMQYSLRKMSIALVGIPNQDHPSAPYAEKYFWSSQCGASRQCDSAELSFTWSDTNVYMLPKPKRNAVPLLSTTNVTLDDAVIHFRCGDLMSSTHYAYSLMSFYDYTRFISKEARTIGILTQPFEKYGDTLNRDQDSEAVLFERCRIVVTSLLEYTQESFPNAKITIRNDRDESTALVYARMIMANQTVVGISAFSLYAALSVFGTSYIPAPSHHSPNLEVTRADPFNRFPPNVVVFKDVTLIMVADLKALWESPNGTELVLNWFWNK